jgi:hypothetical protein
MNSPRSQSFWRAFAQGCVAVLIRFAMVASTRHCFWARHRQSSHDLRSLRCYPSPSLRSGPSQAGPILMCDPCNPDCASIARNRFQICDIAVESGSITTNLRGSTKCRSRLSSSVFFPCRLPVACRIPRLAAWQALRPVRLSPMQPTAIFLLAQSSAALRASPRAASSWACRPATRATERLTDPVVHLGGPYQRKGPSGRNAPGGPFSFAPDGGSRCLTRS